MNETLFTIDLLHGRGRPEQVSPARTAAVTAFMAVPVAIVLICVGVFATNKIVISDSRGKIDELDKKIAEYGDIQERQKQAEAIKGRLNDYFNEVNSSLYRHQQWSSVIELVVDNIPNFMVLTEFNVKQRFNREQVPQKDDPQKQVSVNIPVRTLHMSLSGNIGLNWDKEVKDFCDGLKNSDLLKDRISDIKVSQEFGTLDGREAVEYIIDCYFKADKI
ncbi:MAG: hypothetical protein PHF37_09700 [Phycisphaerae bacterium]|nr:hypothetical protein [Phycisphaerae bacterium]